MKEAGHLKKIGMAVAHATDDLVDVAPYFVLGAFAAAILSAGVDRNTFIALVSNPFSAILVMMFIAGVLNLCADADAFVGASFRMFPFAGVMSFLTFGPMFDLKLLAMYSIVYKRRAIAALVVLVFLFNFAVNAGLHYLLTPLTGGAING